MAGEALNVAGYSAVARSDFRGARTRFDEGLTLFSSLVDDRSIAWSLRGRSFANRLAGDVVAPQADEERSLTICRATNDLRGEAWSVHDLGEIAFALDDLDRAEQLLEEGLDRFEEHGVAFGAYRAIILLGDVNRRRTQWSDAITRYEQAWLGNVSCISWRAERTFRKGWPRSRWRCISPRRQPDFSAPGLLGARASGLRDTSLTKRITSGA